uniref:RING-type domain-containing protein n=1 Tax=Caenorhabditis japonica TaxID=281687 RepID=A0A8R1DHF8_CAEJA
MLKPNVKTNMFGFFRKLMPKDEKKVEKRRILKHLEEADVCVIDLETLRCAVCLNIYQGIPQTLTCGHSFCLRCIEEVAHSELLNDPRELNRNTFHCPICRKRVHMSKVVQNYTLKAVLESINELSKEEEKSRKAYDNTLDASNEQLRLKCVDMERTVDGLKRQISEMRRKEYYNYVAISFFIIVYIILSTMFGN